MTDRESRYALAGDMGGAVAGIEFVPAYAAECEVVAVVGEDTGVVDREGLEGYIDGE